MSAVSACTQMFYANAEGQFQTRLIALFIFAKGARVHVRILVVNREGADGDRALI